MLQKVLRYMVLATKLTLRKCDIVEFNLLDLKAKVVKIVSLNRDCCHS